MEIATLQPGTLVRHTTTRQLARIVILKPDPFWFPVFGGEPAQMAYVSPDDCSFGDYWSFDDFDIIPETADATPEQYQPVILKDNRGTFWTGVILRVTSIEVLVEFDDCPHEPPRWIDRRYILATLPTKGQAA